MKYSIEKAPLVRDTSLKTSGMYKDFVVAILPLVLFSFYKNGLSPFMAGNATVMEMLKPLLMIIVAGISGMIFETLFVMIFNGYNTKEEFKKFHKGSYSLIPGILMGMVLPLSTPYGVVVFGSFVASIIGKMLFGGFGHNIFNPALIGRAAIVYGYSGYVTSTALAKGLPNAYFNGKEAVDLITGATPLSNLNEVLGSGSYDLIVGTYGSITDFFFGFIPGANAETSAFLCLISFAYLIYKKVITWRIPTIYVGTVFIIATIVGLSNGMGMWYPLFHIFSGGLMFGAVFMATDLVTSPTTPWGQVFYAFLMGIFTMIFRLLGAYPEGVLSSILLMNMLTPWIDSIFATIKFETVKKKTTIFVTTLLFFVLIVSYMIVRVPNVAEAALVETTVVEEVTV